MNKVIKIGALLIVSTGIVYTSYIMYEGYLKKFRENAKAKDVQPLFPVNGMGNVTCIVPPCLQ